MSKPNDILKRMRRKTGAETFIESMSENGSVSESVDTSKKESVPGSENASVNTSEPASVIVSKPGSIDVSKIVSNKTTKPKFEETHTKNTYWIRNDILEALNKIATSKGDKTEAINQGLLLYFEYLQNRK